MADGQPDHSSIIAEVARLGEQVRGVVKHLEAQDVTLDMLKTAYNIQAGKGAMAKTFYTLLAGGLGAGLVKLAEYLTHNGVVMPPPGTPGGQ